MIQRIQTIWLLLASVCVFLTLKFATYAADKNGVHLINGTENTKLLFATIATGIVPLFAVFLYKKRKQQLLLTLLGIVLQLVLGYLYYKEIQLYVGTGSVSFTAILHILTLVFLLLAAKGIRADEKLIKDSNRLR